MPRFAVSLGLLLAATCIAGCSHDYPPAEFNFLLGYARTEFEESGGLDPIIDRHDGARTAMGIDVPTMGTTENGSGLRLGGRLAFSWLRDETGERPIEDEPDLFVEDFVDVSFITPQVVASFRQVIGDPATGAAFIEPGVGLGPTLATMNFGSDLFFGDSLVATDIDDREHELGFAVNPFIRGGFTRGRFLLGVEGGYEWMTLSFDHDLGDDPSLWYVGAFLAIELGGSFE